MGLALGVLISGTGSNLGAILAAVAEGRLDATVRVVASNKADALGLDRARNHGVPAVVLPHQAYADRAAYDAALVEVLRAHGVEWVVLAGFMRIVGPAFLGAFPGRVINIHPSLLPAFPGVDAQAQALARGVKVTGCTTHFVDGGVDTGPIIGQRAVRVEEGDTRDALAARILVEEHALLVETLQRVASGEVRARPSP
ncbi:MAG: phosphoribosylglycinamide formyltransferase [Polyangiaceae bacterium]